MKLPRPPLSMHKILVVLIVLAAALSCIDDGREKREKAERERLALQVASVATQPTFSVTNNSGAEETYSLHSGSGCTAPPSVTTGAVAGGATSLPARTIAGNYSMSYNQPALANCASTLFTFNVARTYACSSSQTLLTCQ